MSPQAKNFKVGSIIYFESDRSESVFLLKSGKVDLVYEDPQLAEKVVDQISTGEFFGVKSGLIKKPREETAKVAANSIVLEFSANEFEALIMKNPNIILKMLKVFSNQLRKIGKKIQTLVSKKVSGDSSDEFFQIGEYYLKNKKYKQAMTVYQRYLHYYPDGTFSSAAAKRLEVAEKALDSYGDGGGPAPEMTGGSSSSSAPEAEDVEELTEEVLSDQNEIENNVYNTEEEKLYYKGVAYMSQGKYAEAFKIFQKILTMDNEEMMEMANYEIGKCLFHLEKYDKSIDHLSNFIAKNPDFSEKAEGFFYLGSCFIKTGETAKAKKCFEDTLAGSDQGDAVYRKAQRALKEMGG